MFVFMLTSLAVAGNITLFFFDKTLAGYGLGITVFFVMLATVTELMR
jgi:hypothetical protein